MQTEGAYGGVLTEGRYFYNPFFWDWEISKQFEVPNGKIGIRIALDGDGPARAGRSSPSPARRASWRRSSCPAGIRTTRTPRISSCTTRSPSRPASGGSSRRSSGNLPKDPNQFLVGDGERGVQKKTLDPGTYYLNPYQTRVSLVDCRSKRFNLGEGSAMDFLSSDGFPVTLDGAVEFRVIPDLAAEVFVKYNEADNGDLIDEEIIAKIITPESRSLCRTGGSKLSGGQFISGNDREVFQRNLVKSLDRELQEARRSRSSPSRSPGSSRRRTSPSRSATARSPSSSSPSSTRRRCSSSPRPSSRSRS